jgi:hypothetical protein
MLRIARTLMVAGIALLAVTILVALIAILTGCASAPANPAAHYTPPPSPSYTQGTIADYLAWDKAVQPDIAKIGALQFVQPSDCLTALNIVQKLQGEAPPPVAQVSWTRFLDDSETGYAACVNGDAVTEQGAIDLMKTDTAQWVADTRAALPALFSSASASAS